MDIFNQIRDAYDNGGALTPEMLEDLKKTFKVRDDFNKLFSLDVETSPKKMKELLEKNGYTLEVLKNLRFGVDGTDLDKLNVFIAAMNGNTDEFYVASAVYFNHMATEHVDPNMIESQKNCIAKLIAKGYSEENIMKAISDYSTTCQFNLGKSKGIVVKLVRTNAKAKSVGNTSDAEKDNSRQSNIEQSNPRPLSPSKLDNLVKAFFEQNPDLKPDYADDVLNNESEDNKTGTDSAQKEGNPSRLENSFSGQGVNPFDSSYSAETIAPTGSNVEYLDPYLNEFSGNFVEMPNPFEVPYEGFMVKVKKIVKKVKRPISKPDFSKIKKSMLKSLSNLMQKASNALKAKLEMNTDIDELPPRIDFGDYSMEDTSNGKER